MNTEERKTSAGFYTSPQSYFCLMIFLSIRLCFQREIDFVSIAIRVLNTLEHRSKIVTENNICFFTFCYAKACPHECTFLSAPNLVESLNRSSPRASVDLSRDSHYNCFSVAVCISNPLIQQDGLEVRQHCKCNSYPRH